VPFSLKFDWPRQIAWVRVLLAAATLGISYFCPLHVAPLLLFYGVLVLYLVLSLVVVAPRHQAGRPAGLLALFGDAVFFLVLVSFGADRLWLASIFFLYLLAEALAFYGPWKWAWLWPSPPSSALYSLTTGPGAWSGPYWWPAP
jgi:hypothetical protein